MNRLTTDERCRVLACLVEGNSISPICVQGTGNQWQQPEVVAILGAEVGL